MLSAADTAARRHAERESAFESEYRTELQRFDELRPTAEALDQSALTAARLAIRPGKEQEAFDEIHKVFPEKLPVFLRRDITSETDQNLGEVYLEITSMERLQQQKTNSKQQSSR